MEPEIEQAFAAIRDEIQQKRLSGVEAFLGSDVIRLLLQAEGRIRALDENRAAIEQRLGVASQSVSRMYRSGVIVVAGRTPAERHARDSLREFSVNDPRLLLLTYDDVLAIGEATVALFERSLTRRTERALIAAGPQGSGGSR